MPKIDFYILAEKNQHNRTKSDALWTACLLTEKAYLAGLSVYILTEDASQSNDINKLLWAFKQNSFIPHSLDFNSDESVIISDQKPSNNSAIKVLINLSNQLIAIDEQQTPKKEMPQIERILEIIEAEQKAQGRKKYKHYQSLNITPTIHQL